MYSEISQIHSNVHLRYHKRILCDDALTLSSLPGCVLVTDRDAPSAKLFAVTRTLQTSVNGSIREVRGRLCDKRGKREAV